MSIHLKKSCDGCRACPVSGFHSTCSIGFAVKSTVKPVGGYPMMCYAPGEPCPKPRTYDALFKAQSKRGKIGGGASREYLEAITALNMACEKIDARKAQGAHNLTS